MSQALNQLDPVLRPYAAHLVAWIFAQDPHARITSVYRSYDDQLRLWLNRHNNPYPVAPPGRSYHQYRRAWDIVARPEVLRAAGAAWKSWGGTWSESDIIHFQA